MSDPSPTPEAGRNETATDPDAERDCWCPDANLRTGLHMTYCPRHGVTERAWRDSFGYPHDAVWCANCDAWDAHVFEECPRV